MLPDRLLPIFDRFRLEEDHPCALVCTSSPKLHTSIAWSKSAVRRLVNLSGLHCAEWEAKGPSGQPLRGRTWLYQFAGISVYNDVGVVKRHSDLFEPRAGSRAVRRFLSDRSSQTLDAVNGSLHLNWDEACAERCFVLLRILCSPLTKTRSLESYGAISFYQPSIRSSTPDHDSLFELPSLFPGEAGCSTILSMDFGPPRKSPGYPAYEPAALGCPASRSFQYSRTANFRAMATLATALPRRNFSLR